MPDGIQPDIDYSQALVEYLQIPHCTCNIHDAVAGVLSQLEQAGLTPSRQTVSYTHLDVYKRQARSCGRKCPPEAPLAARECGAIQIQVEPRTFQFALSCVGSSGRFLF